MKNALIYLVAGVAALALSLLATMMLEQATADDGVQIEMRADFSRDDVRETVIETIERVQRNRLTTDDTRAGRYAATLQAELSGIRGELSNLLDRVERVASTEPTIEGGDVTEIPHYDRIAAIVAETVLAQREQQARERDARREERDIVRKEKALERRRQTLTKQLDLRDDQVTAVLGIYDEYESKRSDMFKDMRSSGDRLTGTQIRDVMKGLENGMNSALSGVLDETQYEKYLKNRARSTELGRTGLGDRGGRRSASGSAGNGEGGGRRSRGGNASGRRRGRER